MVVKKVIRDSLLGNLLSGMTITSKDGDAALDQDAADDEERKARIDLKTAKALINALAGWAGKGKDEVIQVLCREIGVAIAAVLKEPLDQVLENRKLRVSLELVPKSDAEKKHHKAKPVHPKTKSSSKKTSAKP